MNCDHFRERLDELARGELQTDEAAAAERHAAVCRECSVELERARRVLDLADKLPRWVDPPTDLWPGIHVRLDGGSDVARGRFAGGLRTWLVAAAVVVTATGAVLVAYTVGRHPARVVTVERRLTAQAVPARAGTSTAAAVEAEFRAARSELMAAIEQRRDRLSPETIETVYSNLEVIDQAIGRISAALAEDPGNPMLAGQLTRAYLQQIELLQRASRLPAEI